MTLRSRVEHIFGCPGGATLPVFGAICNSPHFDFFPPRHEKGAGYMTEDDAHVSGRPDIIQLLLTLVPPTSLPLYETSSVTASPSSSLPIRLPLPQLEPPFKRPTLSVFGGAARSGASQLRVSPDSGNQRGVQDRYLRAPGSVLVDFLGGITTSVLRTPSLSKLRLLVGRWVSPKTPYDPRTEPFDMPAIK